MATTPSIVCKDCSHVNEAQRVYCHNCGVKLDRSAVTQEAQKGKESNEQKQKRVRKMMNPSGRSARANVASLVRAVFWGAVAGLIINIIRPPEGVPPMPEDALPEAPPLGIYLQEISSAMSGRMLGVKEADINLYLSSVLRPKGKPGESSFVQFQRAFVNLTPDHARLTSQSALLSHPLYMGITFEAKGERDRLTAKPVALHFGRITIPEFIAQHLEAPANILFSSLASALKQERQSLGDLGGLQIREGAVVIASRGTTIPEPPAASAAPAPAAPALPESAEPPAAPAQP